MWIRFSYADLNAELRNDEPCTRQTKGATYDVFIGGALHKPEGFPVSKPVAGFQLGYSL